VQASKQEEVKRDKRDTREEGEVVSQLHAPQERKRGKRGSAFTAPHAEQQISAADGDTLD
jgi:hypothetical protein